MEQERAYLDGIVKRMARLSPVPVTSALLVGPGIAEMLSGHATATKADLVVMTSHGRDPLSRFWLGSVADEMLLRATTPILVVRPQEAPDFQTEPELRHILIPLDGSVLAEQVLDPAKALGGLMQADFTLLRVYGPAIDVDPFTYAGQDGFEAAEQLRVRAQDYLNRTAEGFQGQGCNVQTHLALGQHPATAILDTAQSLTVSLIALETHGRSDLLPRLFLGSVADKVIRGASVPVLVHRSPNPENRA
jgi:nucleotide-binding universal stress UspA family protein